MSLGSRFGLGRLAFRNWVRSQDIHPALVEGDLPSLNYSGVLPLPRNYIAGLGTANGTDADHDINILAGQARSTGDTGNILVTSTITKQIDATWAEGSAGGLNDTNHPVGNATWYHVFILGKSTNDAYDAGFDTSITAANLLADTAVVAAGYTTYRRIGSVLTDGSANIYAYTQVANQFFWTATKGTSATGATQNAANTTTLTGVPTGIRPLVEVQWFFHDASLNLTAGTIYSVDTANETPNTSSTTPFSMIYTDNTPARIGGRGFFRTNTSAQIKYRVDSAGTIDNVDFAVYSWIDDFGVYS